ncbi:MAG: hypothetical protein LBQ47_01690 [Endomicrobium sp.]|jgi:hypothetical protein|nr:hypothetical protein [Endomicrobium sp.]
MKLSPHFDLQEFLHTSRAELLASQGQEVKNYIPSLKALCLYILEPIREFYNAPVIISSGFRGKSLNTAVGGSATSQHSLGQAADITVKGIDPAQIIKDIKTKKLSFHFGQCIFEKIGGKEWVHISLGYPFRLDKPNMQILQTLDGKNYTEV